MFNVWVYSLNYFMPKLTPSSNTLLWKFILDGFKSAYGDCTWKIGEWKKESVAIKCQKGFHASTRIIDALFYVKGSILAQVEVKGICDKEDDKQCWTEMRLVKAYKWTAQDSVKLAIYSAELVIDIFEKKYPKDKRPRQAIDAARAYLANPTKDTAARAADAADAAAYAAARAAARAARAARAKNTLEKIEDWLVAHVKELEEIK